MILLALLLAGASPPASPVVLTDAGAIEGELTSDGRALFHGIAFAAPPVGPLRWRPPAPVVHWAGVHPAIASAPACPQIDYGWNHEAAARQSEDCLYLDVGTPDLKPASPLPVMVWIHGGGNRGGSAAGTIESPIVRRGVVLVSVQYRLNALGFLSHPALGRISGNYGLMDQQAALRWVKHNIAAFGGDPGNITIFGESAGAQDVGLQLLSPGAHGLFAKAIEESGSPGFGVAPRTLRENERLGEMLVARAGAKPGADAAALRSLPVEALVEASETVDVPDLDDDSFIWLQAVVDGVVLQEPPADALAKGEGARIPLIIGNNARELPLYGGDAGVDRAVRRAFGTNRQRALAFYAPGGAGHPLDDPRLGDLATQIANDINFRCPALSVARLRARAGGSVWHYQFDVPPAGGGSVTHGSDIAFVLGSAGAAPDAVAPMAAYWVNFAQNGDPNGPGLPLWPHFTEAQAVSLIFVPDGPHLFRNLRAPLCRLRAATLP